MSNTAYIETLKNIDIRTVDPDTLVDIRDVAVDISLPKQEQTLDFIRKIKNPYCYKCGKMIVKVSHTDTEVTIEDRLESYLLSL